MMSGLGDGDGVVHFILGVGITIKIRIMIFEAGDFIQN